MSYILNALRKSEQERQAVEPDSITDRIVVNHASRHRSSLGLIVGLVIINVAILAYFLGFSEKNSATDAEIAVAKLEEPVPKNEKAKPIASNHEAISKKDSDKVEAIIPAVPKSTPVPTPNKPPIKPTDVAEMKRSLAEMKKRVIAEKAISKAVTPTKPISADKTITDEPIKRENAPITPVSPEITNPIEPDIQTAKTDKIEAEKTVSVPVRDQLPFLDELPYDFQRELPLLPINVFSYSDVAAERFVMIDMVKYVPGQSIKDVLDLKEIRSDGMVVNYHGRTFKIRRP